jgi:FkbM family methyltransferase
VEVGAHDGETFSNGWVLENCLGWQGVCIEANPKEDGFPKLVQRRPLCHCVNVAVGATDGGSVKFESKNMLGHLSAESDGEEEEHDGDEEESFVRVPARSLGKLLQEKGLTNINVLSIDCEGCEASWNCKV